MESLAEMPDNAFDLAIVDPPYGIGMDGIEWNNTATGKRSVRGKTKGLKTKKKGWDTSIPHEKYFSNLIRISRNQIVWGGNYFSEFLNPSRGWVCWDKKQPDGIKFSQFELAWTSFDVYCRTFRLFPTHVTQGKKIHPCQKPISLYEWLLENYAKPGQTILDTHLGSGSIAIACERMGYSLTGFEIDQEYFDGAVNRFKKHLNQPRLDFGANERPPDPIQLTIPD